MSRQEPHLKIVCYQAFCRVCLEVVSPAPRHTFGECDDDLRAHRLIQHPRGGNRASR